MRYYVQLNETEYAIDVERAAGGAWKVMMDDKPINADVLQVEGGLNVIVEGHSLDLCIEGSAPDLGVVTAGKRLYAKVESERMRATASAKGAGAGAAGGLIASPMPGRVVKVLVNEGDEVTEGQGVAVVEAMKMENELFAPIDGVVSKIHAAAGEAVEGGAPLITIKGADEG